MPVGKGCNPGKMNWMQCFGGGGMADPACFENQPQAGREPTPGKEIGCCVLAGWMTDEAFGPVCFQSDSRREGSRPREKELDDVLWQVG
jgi:hypothetical protein